MLALLVLNTTNCTAKDLPGGQKHTAEVKQGARFRVRSKLTNHLQQKQSIVDNTVIACTYDTSSLIRQTGKFTFVIGQHSSSFSAGALAAAGL